MHNGSPTTQPRPNSVGFLIIAGSSILCRYSNLIIYRQAAAAAQIRWLITTVKQCISRRTKTVPLKVQLSILQLSFPRDISPTAKDSQSGFPERQKAMKLSQPFIFEDTDITAHGKISGTVSVTTSTSKAFRPTVYRAKIVTLGTTFANIGAFSDSVGLDSGRIEVGAWHSHRSY
jgi:hypothetical protein